MKNTALILIMILITMGLFAAEVSLSGNFEYGFIGNKNGMTETVAESETTISAVVSEFVILDTTFLISPDSAVLDELAVTADVGNWYGLPFGYVLMVSALGSAENNVDISILHLDCDFDFDPDKKQIYLGGVVNPGPVSIEGYCDSDGRNLKDGLVGGNIDFDSGSAEVNIKARIGMGVEYDLLGETYSFDYDTYLTLNPVGIGVSVEGSEVSRYELVCFDADWIDYGGIDLVLTINLEEVEKVRGIDTSVYVSIDVVDFRLGYLSTEFGEGDENAPAAPQDGGIYAIVEVSY